MTGQPPPDGQEPDRAATYERARREQLKKERQEDTGQEVTPDETP